VVVGPGRNPARSHPDHRRDNGLAFTAVAEIAGPRWAGRAFGIQNTGQYLTAAAVPPVAGLLIQHCGYGWTFAAVALFAAAAVPLVPRPTDG